MQAAKDIVAHYTLPRHPEGSDSGLEGSSQKRSFDKLETLRILASQHPPISQDDTFFPNTYEDLIALPGVGDYVANAILAFAHNQDVAVIDTNIRRILIYHF